MKALPIPAVLVACALLVPALGQAGGIRAGLATISKVEGVVLVSEAGRFSTASVGGGLLEGSRLLTMEGAVATVTYGDGCLLEVSANTMVVFRNAGECTSNSVDSQVAGRQYASLGAPTAGAAVASAGTVATTTAAVSSAGAIGSLSAGGGAASGLFGVSAAGVLAGASVLAVGVSFAVSDQNDNDRQVTPEVF